MFRKTFPRNSTACAQLKPNPWIERYSKPKLSFFSYLPPGRLQTTFEQYDNLLVTSKLKHNSVVCDTMYMPVIIYVNGEKAKRAASICKKRL